MTRRNLLARLTVAPLSRQALAGAISSEPDAVLSRIRPPSFAARYFPITSYGAVGDGSRKCTAAITSAIRACAAAGGGSVVVPKGDFLTGAIHLDSNVNLHLSEGATLRFSTDPADYPIVFTRFESTECMNYSPFIYAYRKQNIAVTGPGLLDGQASENNWWHWTRRARGNVTRGARNGAPGSDVQTLVEQMANNDVPVAQRIFGPGHYLRPNFIQPYRCQNVLLDGFSVRRSPMWELNPTLCHNVTIRGIHIDSHGPNNDGCDPDACTDVLIERCTFSTGDDCIAIKAGRNRDGRRVGVPTSNVVIQDCVMRDGHGGVSIGSEVSGGIANVYIRRCQMNSPNLQRALRVKTNSYRGGVIQNIVFADITVGQVADDVVAIDFYYEEGEGGPFKPSVKNVLIRNVTCQKSKYAIYLAGYQDAPISGVTLKDCDFNGAKEGILARNVENVTLESVKVNGRSVTHSDLITS